MFLNFIHGKRKLDSSRPNKVKIIPFWSNLTIVKEFDPPQLPEKENNFQFFEWTTNLEDTKLKKSDALKNSETP